MMTFIEFYQALSTSEQQALKKRVGISEHTWQSIIHGKRGIGRLTASKLLCADARITLAMLWPDVPLPPRYH